MELNDKLILIDGNSLINRAFYALPPLNAKDGTPVNAVYGFANMLIKLITDYRPKYMAVAFDMRAKTFRHQMYEGYKATRKGMPDDLAVQMPILKEMLKAMNIRILQQEGIEADDIIGTMAKAHLAETLIVTGDRDALQLIDDSITVLLTKRGITEILTMDTDALQASYGLTPAQIVDYKALAGDSSDNIPGVAGIGDKTATELLKAYGSFSGIYENLDQIKGSRREKLELGREMGELSHRLAQIKTDCTAVASLEDCTYSYPFSAAVMDFFVVREFRSLVKRAELFESDAASQPPIQQAVSVIELTSKEQLKIVLNGRKKFALSFADKISLSFDGMTQYDIPVSRTLFDTAMTVDDALSVLSEQLSSKDVTKLVYDAKSLIKQLGGLGVQLAGYEDVALMNYLVSAQSKLTSAEGLAEQCGMDKAHAAAALFRTYETHRKELKEQGMEELYYEIELPLISVLFHMEEAGFKVDTVLLNSLKAKYSALEAECAQRIFELASQTFNINSPKQLAKVLFEDMLLPNPNKSGKLSTSAEILEKISALHPIVPEVLRYRFITKLYSTYLVGLERLVGHDGIVHTEFNQMLTSTGRLSSSEPNLQNIPVREDEGKALRGLFIAREGNYLIAADYSQIELRVMAHLSCDESLIAAFEAGKDIHTAVASELFDTSSPTRQERRVAKTVNFGIIYGMSAFGLSERLGIPPRQAKEFIERYFVKYPRVKAYLDEVVAEAKVQGCAQSIFRRRRAIPELKSSNFQIRSFGERAAMNMPLQSSAADIIKVAMLRVSSALSGMKSQLILQVHDELIVDTAADEVEQVKQILTREMEGACPLRVPLVVDVKVGRNWQFDE